jgi:hypothetical protein
LIKYPSKKTEGEKSEIILLVVVSKFAAVQRTGNSHGFFSIV